MDKDEKDFGFLNFFDLMAIIVVSICLIVYGLSSC